MTLLFYEICLVLYVMKNRELIIAQMTEIYSETTLDSFRDLLFYAFSFDGTLSLAAYFTGFCALMNNKPGMFECFTHLFLATIFTRIVISYISIVNLLVFVLKIITYIYARFQLTLLLAVRLTHSTKQQ